MARTLKPPTPLEIGVNEYSLFLAGSIDLGLAENWQQKMEESLADLPIVILNPRRNAWDASWEQSIKNPQFREQVEWELEAQERANLIVMYFAPATKAPITLLELGLFARSGKVFVCCPLGYWRRGNIEIVCARYGISLFNDLESLVDQTRSIISLSHC
jgi:hypothetical protein